MKLRDWALLGSAVAMAVTGCSTSTTTPAPSTTVSASALPSPTSGTLYDKPITASVSALNFINQDGQQVSFDSLKGKYVVLADFLSLCQEICPLTSANFRVIQQRVAAAGLNGQVMLVEATVDPARDTSARLKAYQALWGAQPNWEFLTGTAAQVAALWNDLGVSYQRVGEDPGVHPIDWWTGKVLTFDVNHADVVFILGPDGHQKWLIQGPPNAVGQTLPSKLQTFLNGNGRTNQSSPTADAWTPQEVISALAYVTGHSI